MRPLSPLFILASSGLRTYCDAETNCGTAQQPSTLVNAFSLPGVGWSKPSAYNVTATGVSCGSITSGTERSVTVLSTNLTKLKSLVTADCKVVATTKVKLISKRDGTNIALTANVSDLVQPDKIGIVAGFSYKALSVAEFLDLPHYVSSVKFKAQPIIARPVLHLVNTSIPDLGCRPVVVRDHPISSMRVEDVSTGEVQYQTDPARAVLVSENPLGFLELAGRDAFGEVPFAPTLRSRVVDGAELTLSTPEFNPTYTYVTSKDKWTLFKYSIVLKDEECEPDRQARCKPLMNRLEVDSCLAALLPPAGCKVNVEAYASQTITYPAMKLTAGNDTPRSTAVVLGEAAPPLYGKAFHLINVKFGSQFNSPKCYDQLELHHSPTGTALDVVVGDSSKLAGAVPKPHGEIEFDIPETSGLINPWLVAVPNAAGTANNCSAKYVFPRVVYSLGNGGVKLVPQTTTSLAIGSDELCEDIPDWCRTSPDGQNKLIEVCLFIARKQGCKAVVTRTITTEPLREPVELDNGVLNRVPAIAWDPLSLSLGTYYKFPEPLALVSVQLDVPITGCNDTRFVLGEIRDNVKNPFTINRQDDLNSVLGSEFITSGGGRKFTVGSFFELDDREAARYIVMPVSTTANPCAINLYTATLVLQMTRFNGGHLPEFKSISSVESQWKEVGLRVIQGVNCTAAQRTRAFAKSFQNLTELQFFLDRYPDCAVTVIRELHNASPMLAWAPASMSMARFQLKKDLFTTNFPQFSVRKIELGQGVTDEKLAKCLVNPKVATVEIPNADIRTKDGVQFSGSYLRNRPFELRSELDAVGVVVNETHNVVQVQVNCTGIDPTEGLEYVALTLQTRIAARPPILAASPQKGKFAQSLTRHSMGACKNEYADTFEYSYPVTFSDPAELDSWLNPQYCDYLVEVEVTAVGPVPRVANGYGFALDRDVNGKAIFGGIPKLTGYVYTLKSVTLGGGILTPDCEVYKLGQGAKDFDASNSLILERVDSSSKRFSANVPYDVQPIPLRANMPFLAIVQDDNCAGAGPAQGRDSLVFTLTKETPKRLPTVETTISLLLDQPCQADTCVAKPITSEADLISCIRKIRSSTCEVIVLKKITQKGGAAILTAGKKYLKGAQIKLAKEDVDTVKVTTSISKELKLSSIRVFSRIPIACEGLVFTSSGDGVTWDPLATPPVRSNEDTIVTPHVHFRDDVVIATTSKSEFNCDLEANDLSLTFQTEPFQNSGEPDPPARSGMDEKDNWRDSVRLISLADACDVTSEVNCKSKKTLSEIQNCLEEKIKPGCTATLERTLTAMTTYSKGALVGNDSTPAAVFVLDKVDGVLISAPFKEQHWTMTKAIFTQVPPSHCSSLTKLHFVGGSTPMLQASGAGPVHLSNSGVLSKVMQLDEGEEAFVVDCAGRVDITPVITLQLTADFGGNSQDWKFHG